MKNVGRCIRFFGNLFAIDEQACSSYVRQRGFLSLLQRAFTYCDKSTRKEVLWIVSNIAANSEEDANAIVESELVNSLNLHCMDVSSHEIRKEACWALSNVLVKVTEQEVIERVLQKDVVATLLYMLERNQESGAICSLAITGVYHILAKSETAQAIFHRLGGQDIISDFQLSEYHEIYKMATDILERFCGATEMTSLEKMEFINSKEQDFKI